jgi:hypothetical protein
MLRAELAEPITNATTRFIEALAEKHDRAIEVFGGALWIDPTNMGQIVDYLPTIIDNAKFWRWHGGLADACRTFCRCLFVDPALVECAIGMKFETLVA